MHQGKAELRILIVMIPYVQMRPLCNILAVQYVLSGARWSLMMYYFCLQGWRKQWAGSDGGGTSCKCT